MEQNDTDESFETDLDDEQEEKRQEYIPPRISSAQRLAAHRSNRLGQTFGQVNLPFDRQSPGHTDRETLVAPQCKVPAENTRVRVYENSCKALDVMVDWQIRGFLPYDTITIVDRAFSFNDFRAFATAIESNLDSLTLREVNLTSAPLQVLCLALAKCVRLTFLDLSDNKLGRRGFNSLITTLENLPSLLYLSLANCDIEDSYGLKIGDICRHERLLEVNLTGNKLEENACIFIGNAMTENTSLTYLNLSWNRIRSFASIALFRGIDVNTCLTELDISWSGLSYEGSVALRRVLVKNKTLERLNISSCNVEWKSAKLISEGLAKNSTLQNLNMAYNPITTHGAQYIIQAIDAETSAITMLDLSGITIYTATVRLAETISARREFALKYDCEIPVHDVLGRQRSAAKGDSMRTVIEHIESRHWRMLEYFRMLKKGNQSEVNKEDVTLNIVKSGVQLENHEIDDLHQRLTQRSTEPLTYKNLNSIFKEQRLRDRSLKARQNKQEKDTQKRNQKILQTVSHHFPGIEVVSKQQQRREAIEQLAKPRLVSAKPKP